MNNLITEVIIEVKELIDITLLYYKDKYSIDSLPKIDIENLKSTLSRVNINEDNLYILVAHNAAKILSKYNISNI